MKPAEDRYYRANEPLNFPPLTREEELELANKARAGDLAARELFITRHLLYAMKLGRRFCAARLPVDETTSAANEALMKAVDRFDPSKGFAFRSFLVPFVRAAVAKCWRSRAPLNFKHGTPPIEVPLDERDNDRSKFRRLPEELIEQPTVEQADYDGFLKGELAACCENLSVREKLVIKLHFVDGFNLAEIAKQLEPPLTRERVRQILEEVLAILRGRMKDRGVTKSQ